MSKKTAITPTRRDDFALWYQSVIKEAQLAENSPVRGCMVIKPWGYRIWERIKAVLDAKISALGHENAYFPLFIPLHFLEKEAQHVEGFATECAVVTHHRLELKEGKMIPASPLEEPLVVRPTSETIIGHTFAKWISSYRDLPLLINQWSNVVRWEMRPRLFLRSTEILWQEGHTVHETAKEAEEEALLMLNTYCDFTRNLLALPSIVGRKTEKEKFPGANETYTFEMMMQDGKALQAGTSHDLGQNFAKGFQIRFTDRQGELQYGYMTSWGVTTRLIGALVMVHGDDDGLRLPPRIAPQHVVIIPFLTQEEKRSAVLDYANSLAEALRACDYEGEPLRVLVDTRELRGGEKKWQWVKQGVPIRLEVGPRDCDAEMAVLSRRDSPATQKETLSKEALMGKIPSLLCEMQEYYLQQAEENLRERVVTDILEKQPFIDYFTRKEESGFLQAPWCGQQECEECLKEWAVSIRCLPLNQKAISGSCVLCGQPASVQAIFAKAY